ncbi:glycosyltransferase family 4 protein [Limnochorda pilosa]|uniref:Glycosyl transferase family 1 n=1 Tax=Limnochorda pilosa TaxID=1555112 RepID=A0A0K2SJ22_LIMPI|nr:glycosyltransferase family 4 protein [Limnochorda pilosa]BAS27027.1 glycosyl transferase family 1 [Limnochorda pilosa]
MRIGMFSDSYRPYVSGVVRSIESFAGELRRRGHAVAIFAPSYPGHREDEPDVYRFRSVRAPSNPEFSLALPFAPHLTRRARELALDVIHVHSPFLMGRLGARLARRLGVPVVFTHHTLYDEYVHYVPFTPPQVTRRLTVHWVRSFANRCDLVIAPSQPVEARIRAQGVTRPIRVIPTGIDPDALAAGDPGWLSREWATKPGDPVLLYVGRLAREKNLEFLLEAMALILPKVPRAWLVLAAGGPDRERLEARARALGVAGRVIMTGFLPHERVIDAYAGADLFVFASQTETQGLVIAESMAAGLPVVAVSASGVTDLVRDGIDGYLTPHDVPTFVERVLELLSNKERRDRMAAEARRRAAELSVARMTDRLLQAYADAGAEHAQAQGPTAVG